MTDPSADSQIKILATAVENIWRVVDELAVQWSAGAYLTGEPEPNMAEENDTALERRAAMLAAREALNRLLRDPTL
jgi:hypothetical protein